MYHIWMERYLSLFSLEIDLASIRHFWKKWGPKHRRVSEAKLQTATVHCVQFTSQAHFLQPRPNSSPTWPTSLPPAHLLQLPSPLALPLAHHFPFFPHFPLSPYLPITSHFLLPCYQPPFVASLFLQPPYLLQPAPSSITIKPFQPLNTLPSSIKPQREEEKRVGNFG